MPHVKGSSPTSSSANSRGFTLIEVLIAGVILFMALAAGMSAYQTAMGGSQAAAQQVKLMQVSELVQAHIKKAIQDAVSDNGQGLAPQQLDGQTALFEVDVNWQASLVEQGSPPARFDESALNDVNYAPRFFQYQVTLQLHHDSRARSFTYRELAWSPRTEMVVE